MTPELKALLKEKKRDFKSGDKEEQRRVQKELKRGIRRCNDNYRKKLEKHLTGEQCQRGLERPENHLWPHKEQWEGP